MSTRDRKLMGKKLSEGFLTYSDSKYRLILTRIRNHLMSQHAGEIHDLESLRRVLVAHVSEGKPFITAVQLKDLLRRSGIRDAADLEFFWTRMSTQSGVPGDTTLDLGRLATALQSRSPTAASSHAVAAELGAASAIDKFLHEYNDMIEKKFAEIERAAAKRLETLARENQTLKTQVDQLVSAAQNAPAPAPVHSESSEIDKEKMAKMQKALIMAREKIQGLEASESEARGLLLQKDEEIERLKQLASTLKKQTEEQEAKLQQTVDIAKKRVTKLAEEIRDLRAERDDYRQQLGLSPVQQQQQLQQQALHRTLTSPGVMSSHVSPTSPRTNSTRSAGNCNTCGQPILDTFYTQTKNRIYHKDCFKCLSCGKSIPEGKFGEDPTDGKPRCGACWTSSRTPKCKSCGDPITDTSVEALGFSYHQSCFKCSSCQQQFDGTFFHLEGKPYCESCMEKQQ